MASDYILVMNDGRAVELDALNDSMTTLTVDDDDDTPATLDINLDQDLDDAIDKARQELKALKSVGQETREISVPALLVAQQEYDEETRRLEERWKSIKREARQTYTFAMRDANAGQLGADNIPPLYVFNSQVLLLETMFLTFSIYFKQIRIVDKQDAAIVDYLQQQELKPLQEQAQTRRRQVLEQVSMVAASNHALYDHYLAECHRQETEIRALRAIIPVDKNNNTNHGDDDDDDDATLDLSESENYDELLLHGDSSGHSSSNSNSNSSSSSSKHLLFQSSIKSFADSWTSFCHEQPERLSSTKHRVSESLSSTSHRVSESLVNFAVEQMGKNIPGC